MTFGVVACRTVIEQFPGGLASAAIFPRYWPAQSAGSKSSTDKTGGDGRLAQSVARVIIVGDSFSNRSPPLGKHLVNSKYATSPNGRMQSWNCFTF